MRVHGCVQLRFSGGIECRIRHFRPTSHTHTSFLAFLTFLPRQPFPSPKPPLASEGVSDAGFDRALVRRRLDTLLRVSYQ